MATRSATARKQSPKPKTVVTVVYDQDGESYCTKEDDDGAGSYATGATGSVDTGASQAYSSDGKATGVDKALTNGYCGAVYNRTFKDGRPAVPMICFKDSLCRRPNHKSSSKGKAGIYTLQKDQRHWCAKASSFKTHEVHAEELAEQKAANRAAMEAVGLAVEQGKADTAVDWLNASVEELEKKMPAQTQGLAPGVVAKPENIPVISQPDTRPSFNSPSPGQGDPFAAMVAAEDLDLNPLLKHPPPGSNSGSIPSAIQLNYLNQSGSNGVPPTVAKPNGAAGGESQVQVIAAAMFEALNSLKVEMKVVQDEIMLQRTQKGKPDSTEPKPDKHWAVVNGKGGASGVFTNAEAAMELCAEAANPRVKIFPTEALAWAWIRTYQEPLKPAGSSKFYAVANGLTGSNVYTNPKVAVQAQQDSPDAQLQVFDNYDQAWEWIFSVGAQLSSGFPKLPVPLVAEQPGQGC